jgi:hypothetical protein
LKNQATDITKATPEIKSCLILSFLRHSNSDRLSLFMRKSRKILLSDQEVEGSLDQDVDDYEDSRIELQAIGLNLVGRHSFCSAHLRLYI